MRATTTSGTGRTSRRFFLLGACGLLAITVIQVPYVADLWEQRKSQRLAAHESAGGFSASERAARLEQYTQSTRDELARFEQSMVGVEMMPTIQSELMDLARASGCQLRKAVVQASATEIWEPEKPPASDEEPEYDPQAPAPLSQFEEESPYRLATEQLSLSLTGTLAQTLDFLDRVREQSWLMRVAQINFSRDTEGRGQLNVEASLAFYKLVQQASTSNESVQWREGSRAGKVQ